MSEPSTDAATFRGMRLVTVAEVTAATSVAEAVDALESALRSGLDPESDTPRSRIDTATGQLLLMPSTMGGLTGTKVLTTTVDNPGRGLPSIQGVFILFAGAGQRPVALIDGPALTLLRTPAVSALAVRLLTHPGTTGPARLAVVGTGPQARAHVHGIRAVRELSEVALIGRSAERLRSFAAEVTSAGLPVTTHAMDRAEEAVADADIICCCTAAQTPLFAGGAVPDHAVVVAMGAHTPGTRELDSALMARATVVVESRASALRESGEVIQAVHEGALDEGDLLTLRDLVTSGQSLPGTGPRVFTGTGMPWQDLVVGAHIYRALVRAGERGLADRA